MSMSSAVGEIIALGLTPLMVPTPDYIALMNIVWFIPAALGFVLCIYKVTYQGKNYKSVLWQFIKPHALQKNRNSL